MHIIWHDAHLLIVNKPAGLLTVPGRGTDKQDCLLTRLQADYPDSLTVHRLDQATSGVMVFARSKWVQSRLSYQFMHRRVVKQYEAVVQGEMNESQGEIHLPLAADWPARPKQKVDHDKGKPAHTAWRVITVTTHDTAAHTTRLALTPTTGRTHQLRVHLAAIGHPIVGDTLYGASPTDGSARLCLHATELGFVHPISEEKMTHRTVADF